MKALTTLLVLCLTLTSFAQRRIEKEPGDERTAATFTLAPESVNTCKIIVLPNNTGDWIPITTQEAKDVVRAMEIALAPEPSVFTPQETSIMYATNPPIIENSADSPAGLHRRANWLEKLAKAREQRDTDLTWARAVLAAWRKKVEEAK